MEDSKKSVTNVENTDILYEQDHRINNLEKEKSDVEQKNSKAMETISELIRERDAALELSETNRKVAADTATRAQQLEGVVSNLEAALVENINETEEYRKALEAISIRYIQQEHNAIRLEHDLFTAATKAEEAYREIDVLKQKNRELEKCSVIGSAFKGMKMNLPVVGAVSACGIAAVVAVCYLRYTKRT